MNPWDMDRPPCIPDLITLPSYKFGARARGTFQIGTAGVGFVAISPYTGVARTASGLSGFHVYYTSSAYTLASYTDVGGTAGLFANYNDTMLDIANLSRKGFQFRVGGWSPRRSSHSICRKRRRQGILIPTTPSSPPLS